MYSVEAGTPITVIAGDGAASTGPAPIDMPFTDEHVQHRPLKAQRLTENYVFTWRTLTVIVAG